MIIEMKITGCSDEPRLQELFYILSQMKGGEVPPIPPEEPAPEEPAPEEPTPEEPTPVNEKFRVEVKEALDNDEKEAVKKRVRPSRAKKPAPEETRVITDVDLRMKAKSLLDEGKRGKLITALAEFQNGEFPKVSDIRDDASRLEFMVIMEEL